MPSIRIQNFGGIAPRLSDRLLPANAATIARNTKLWSGEVRPFRTPLTVVADVKAGVVKTIYPTRGKWLSWTEDVDVVRGFIPGDATERIYYTGDGTPKVSDGYLATSGLSYPSVAYTLGVARPVTPPVLTIGAGGAGTADLRYYVYTFITGFSEESPPSEPVAITAKQGQQVVITGFAVPTSDNVTGIRLYRTSTGSSSTEYLYVADVLPNTVYTDTILDSDLGELLQSLEWYPPPPAMAGLVAHPNGFLVGFTTNQLHLSVPYQPHAYPPEYVKVFDYPVVALGVYGNTIVVATTGFTYLVTGSDPSNMTVERLPDPYPCVSKRSMVSADRGVVYASNDGLVWVGYGGLQVITRDVMSRDEWQEWSPSTINGISYDGRYIGFFESAGADKGFIFDYNDRATGVEQRDKLTTLSMFATAVYANPDTDFFFVTRTTTNTLSQWEGGSNYTPFEWSSKAYVMPYLTSFAAAKVVGRHREHNDSGVSVPTTVLFELWVGNSLKFTRVVKADEPFRLPRLFRETEPWFFRVFGTTAVQEVSLATSIEELKEGKAQ